MYQRQVNLTSCLEHLVRHHYKVQNPPPVLSIEERSVIYSGN